MALDASMNAALLTPAPMMFCALEIILPDHTIRLLLGSGAIALAGQVYSGSDTIYGTLNAIEPVTDAVGTEAPRVRFTFLPTSEFALASLTNPYVQGSEVSLWVGVANPQTGLVIGQAELLFLGELDEANVDIDKGSRVITFDVASAWDRLFDGNEGARANNAFQQSLYPGDDAFADITGVAEPIFWGFNG